MHTVKFVLIGAGELFELRWQEQRGDRLSRGVTGFPLMPKWSFLHLSKHLGMVVVTNELSPKF